MKVNKITRIVFIVNWALAGAIVVSVGQAQVTGSISGVVVLDNRTPLGKSSVQFVRPAKLSRDKFGKLRIIEQAFSGSVFAAADGSFHIDQLSAGSYSLCASGLRPNHLRSCDWEGGNVTIQVTPGSVKRNVRLNVRTGSLVNIKVIDPPGRIRLWDPKGIKRRQTNLGVAVVSKLGYYAAPLLRHSGAQWSYGIAIPIGLPVYLVLDSGLSIIDGSSKPVPNRVPSVNILAKDTLDVNLNFQVR